MRAYSRLNCEGLVARCICGRFDLGSLRQDHAALPASEVASDIDGVIDVTALNWRWKADGLRPASAARSTMRRGSVNCSRSRPIVRVIWIPAIMPQGHTDNPASHRADKQPIAVPESAVGRESEWLRRSSSCTMRNTQSVIGGSILMTVAPPRPLILCRWWQRQLFQHVTEHHRRKFDDRGKKRGIRAGLENSPHRGHLDGDHERFPCVVVWRSSPVEVHFAPCATTQSAGREMMGFGGFS